MKKRKTDDDDDDMMGLPKRKQSLIKRTHFWMLLKNNPFYEHIEKPKLKVKVIVLCYEAILLYKLCPKSQIVLLVLCPKI